MSSNENETKPQAATGHITEPKAEGESDVGFGFQSDKCQKKDWKTHKYNCSPLYDDATPATFPCDQESGEEIQRMGNILADWMKAFEAKGDAIKSRQFKGSSLPEAASFLDVVPSAHFPHYKREIPSPETKKYRLPIILIARLFLNDLVGGLSLEAKETLSGYINVINMPSSHAKLYGPKVMAQPADLSPGEYISFIASAPIVTMQDYGTCKFSKECQERWKNLATAKLFLWDD